MDISKHHWVNKVEPVFIVGAPRSGTTWLQALIASHPEVYTGPETHFFVGTRTLCKDFEEEQDRKLGLNGYLERDEFYGMIREMFNYTVSRLPQPSMVPSIFLEKSPTHAQHASDIINTFPNARFIHLIRDPRAVVSSFIRISNTWAKKWAPGTVTTGAHIWNRNVESALEIPRILSNPQAQYLEVRYESLRKDAGSILKDLWNWLGLSFDESLLSQTVEDNRIDRNKNSVGAFSSIQAAPANEVKAINDCEIPKDFIGKGAVNIEDFGLSGLQLARIEQLTSELMKQTGYKPIHFPLGMVKRVLTSTTFRKKIGLKEL